jgi:aminoglycoside phosphotransferase family enzyme
VDGRQIYLFDCIAFNRRFRCVDVAAEVAFLAMDLDRYGRSDLGAAFVDAYVQHAGDEELPRLLNFYKAYRAVVRGKVASLRLLEDDLSRAGAAAVADEARAYFALANRYAAVADGAAGT